MISVPFMGFRPATFEWFEGLQANNNKAWFEANRAVFEADVKAPLEMLLEEAAERYNGSVKLFRQNRDIRFSKDKSPYKTNTYGVIRGVGNGDYGYYFSVNADGVTAGTGEYDLAKDQLERLRMALDGRRSGQAFVQIARTLCEQGIEITGNALKTAPRGYAKDHPRIEWLRLKQVLVMQTLPRPKAMNGRDAYDFATSLWDTAAPLLSWLSEHVGPSDIPPEIRFGRGR